jgi:hypothetical protein
MAERTVLFSLIAGTALLLAFSSPASACDTVYQSIPQLFVTSPVIFIGKVIEGPRTGLSTVARFSVEKTLKGTLESEVTVTASYGCDYYFREGETYLIHGRRDNAGTVETGQVFRPMLIKDAGEALKYIESMLAKGPVGILSGPATKKDVTLYLKSSTGTTIRTEVPTGYYEVVAPAGKYTAWVERDGRVLGKKKAVRLEQGKAVWLPLGSDR